MIKFIPNYIEHSDKRGYFHGLINFGNWEEINFICSEAGTIRGNHYHENTDELFIILEGKINIILQRVLGNKDLENNKETFSVKEGDVFLIKKNVNHIFQIIEYSKWINVLSKKIDKEKPDIRRVLS